MESNKSKKSSFVDYGKVPPQSVDLEEAVLGALIIDASSINVIIRYYTPEIFYLDAHKYIFEAILYLFRNNLPIDMLTVTRRLKEMNKLEDVGGAYYIGQITRRVVSSANIDYHARIVFQDYIRRKAIELSSKINNRAFDISVDVFDLIKDFEEGFIELETSIEQPDINPTDMVNTFVDNVTTLHPPSSALFINRSVGIPSLDKLVRWAPNKMLLLAGAAKSGKSKLVSHLVWQLLDNDSQTSVLWVTLEDTANDLLAAYCSSKIFVKPKDILQRKTDNMQKMQIVEATETFKKYDIEFIEQSISIGEIKTRATVFTKNRPGRFIIVVIDNLLSLADRYGFSKNMVQFYDYVIGVTADIRRNTNAFVFLLHHLKDEYSDEGNLESGYRPQLTDIKGSEASRRVPNYTLLMNNVSSHKLLLNQYSGDKKYVAERLMIIDPGVIRDESNIGDSMLVRLYSNLDFNLFKEIE